MKDRNIFPEKRTLRIPEEVPLWLRGLLVVILIAIGFGMALIVLDFSFGIKVFGISYPALSKIMTMVVTVIYVGLMGYFLKESIKELKDKKLTFWQKIARWNFIILIAGTISLIIVMNNWLSFSSDLMRVLSIILLFIMLLSVTIMITCWLFSKDKKFRL